MSVRERHLGTARAYVVGLFPDAATYTGHYLSYWNEETACCPVCQTPLGTADEAKARRAAILYHMKGDGLVVIACGVCSHLSVVAGKG